MKDKLIFTVKQYGMPLQGRRVVVGFSGGSDSAALLSILNELADEWGLDLIAAHVNHGIRGAEADRDEVFVREFCEKRNIPLRVARFDVPGICAQTGESAEECGRRLRYGFFRSVDPDALIATAHNLDDCAETFFLNLARGTGLKGLCGIPPVRDNIIRPLIDCTKAEILEYCEKNNIPYVTDSTNLSSDYNRNRIRHGVLPVLSEINPAFFSCFSRTVSALKKDEATLEQLSDRYVGNARREQGFSVPELMKTPPTLLDRTLGVVLRELTGTAPESRHIRAVAGFLKEGGSENMNGGATVVSDGQLLFCRQRIPPHEKKETVFGELPEKAALPGRELHFLRLTREEYKKNLPKTKKIYKEVCYYFIDCDTIVYPVVIRNRNDGDRIRPPGRSVTKSFKQLCAEKRISAGERQSLAVVADANGVLLAEELGIDGRAAVTDGTREILQIMIRRGIENDGMY